MKFVKPSEYFENWKDAKNAIVDMYTHEWPKRKDRTHTVAIVLGITLAAIAMAGLCLVGLEPD